MLRYLAAYGPASVRHVQAWSGVSRLSATVQRLRPRLCTFRDEHGRELFDLPRAPRPDPQTPAPIRFLPEYDNLLLAHADRTRVLSPPDTWGVFTDNGRVVGTVLIDGFVGATWRIERAGAAATLLVRPRQRCRAPTGRRCSPRADGWPPSSSLGRPPPTYGSRSARTPAGALAADGYGWGARAGGRLGLG